MIQPQKPPESEIPPKRLAQLLKIARESPEPLIRAKSLYEAFDRSPILFKKTSDVAALSDPDRVAISGIGLSWSKYNGETDTLESGLTSGLPIDVMSYLAVIGQRHKYAPDAPKTIFLVSDYFAQGLPGITDEALEAKTNEQIKKLIKITSQLRINGTDKTLLNCLDIRRVSEDVAANQECFDSHYNNLAHHENDYERRQTAAIAMYREITGASVKISYAFADATEPSKGKDERSFDRLSGNYESTSDMSFVYVDVGRATDTSAARVCPYIASEISQDRRLMMGDTDFEKKIKDCEDRIATKKSKSRRNARLRLENIKTYLNDLADLVENTFSVVGNDSHVMIFPSYARNPPYALRYLQRVGLLTLKQ